LRNLIDCIHDVTYKGFVSRSIGPIYLSRKPLF
jgi:hypothetical protein